MTAVSKIYILLSCRWSVQGTRLIWQRAREIVVRVLQLVMRKPTPGSFPEANEAEAAECAHECFNVRHCIPVQKHGVYTEKTKKRRLHECNTFQSNLFDASKGCNTLGFILSRLRAIGTMVASSVAYEINLFSVSRALSFPNAARESLAFLHGPPVIEGQRIRLNRSLSYSTTRCFRLHICAFGMRIRRLNLPSPIALNAVRASREVSRLKCHDPVHLNRVVGAPSE